jgi:hypothetical protein
MVLVLLLGFCVGYFNYFLVLCFGMCLNLD